MSSSKRHKLVGELLQASKHFSHMRIAEEVSVSELVPDFPDNRKKVDWFIKDLRLVIEVHGEQHYQPVAFGGRNAKSEFAKQIHRDKENTLKIHIKYYRPVLEKKRIRLEWPVDHSLQCKENLEAEVFLPPSINPPKSPRRS